MARVADYVIVQDDLFRISRGLEGLNNDSVQTFNFDMPSGFHAGSRTVLMFVMQLGISNVEYRIFLNDQFTLFHGVFSVDYRWHSFHEVIAANSLRQSNNKLEFVLADNGVVDFSDVVLLCQVNT